MQFHCKFHIDFDNSILNELNIDTMHSNIDKNHTKHETKNTIDNCKNIQQHENMKHKELQWCLLSLQAPSYKLIKNCKTLHKQFTTPRNLTQALG